MNPRLLTPHRMARLAFALGLAFSAPARADDTSTPKVLEEITVRASHPAPTASSSLVLDADEFELRPYESPAQILEVTPGLITAQHAGGGKSDQLLLRGFDADHGTDVAISVDQIPVNLRSHAHGQGYTDLHFLIPELVERVEVFKGPYDARVGDFATTGAVNLVLRESVAVPYLHVEGGDFDTLRGVAAWSPDGGVFGLADSSALLAAEGYWSDGPFDFDEQLSRVNLFGRTSFRLGPATTADLWTSLYTGDWNASGQIPQRAVDAGLIDRFGSLNPSDGGTSTRWNARAKLVHALSERGELTVLAWAARYRLELFSDFTFFALDPVNGDGIAQRDDRWLYGGRVEYSHELDTSLPMVARTGLDLRIDDAAVTLEPQRERETLAPDLTNPDTPYARDHVFESSLAWYVQGDVQLLPWLRSVGGFRLERFDFEVTDRTGIGRPDGNEDETVLLPKLNLIAEPFADVGPFSSDYGPLRDLSLYLNYGQGYHSNDARDVVANPHERTLPRALGYEVGVRTRLSESVEVSVAHWWLELEREFVFVGDGGGTEVSPRTRRRGIESSLRWQLTDWLAFDTDVSYSRARYAKTPSRAPVPQAARLVVSSGLRAEPTEGLRLDLRARSLGERHAAEDRGDPRLDSYVIWDLGARYRFGAWELSAKLENLFDADWRSAEFLYESQLAGEPGPVEDFHFTPGNPRNLRVGITHYFE